LYPNNIFINGGAIAQATWTLNPRNPAPKLLNRFNPRSHQQAGRQQVDV
jgi:hypothetical protein